MRRPWSRNHSEGFSACPDSWLAIYSKGRILPDARFGADVSLGRCGIATFTKDLRDALASEGGRKTLVLAMGDQPEGYTAPTKRASISLAFTP